MKVVKNIDIFLENKRNVRLLDVVQYDTGVQIVFTLKDFEIPSGSAATLYVQKPSGKFVYQQNGISIVGNTITVNLENQAITEHGKVPYQVSLTSGTDVITTFTGVMMVERSLKDAGATESRTVINAFDDMTDEKVAEFQAKAEQIVQACIATIPDDYTAMEAKVNKQANAVKGCLSGAVVVADDVSPVEHNPVVRVRSKNHFNANDYITEKDHSNGRTIYAISAANLVIGRTYTVFSSAPMGWFKISNSATGYSCAGTTDYANGFTHYTFTHKRNENIHEADFLYIYVQNLEQEAMYNLDVLKSMNVCIVEGSATTEYTPYIDPSTAVVRRCEKNIFRVSGKTQTINGVTFTMNDDGSVKATGTAEKATFISLGSLYVKEGEKYRLSGSPAGSGFDTYILYIHNNTTGADIYDLGEGKVFTGKAGDSGLTIAVYAGTTVNNLIFRPMVVYGEESGTFEPYNGVEYIPNSNGNIYGITSISPNMTILTDTEGVVVECEYNRDTNKVIEKLTNAITALGGKV